MGGKKLPSKKAKQGEARVAKTDKAAKQQEDEDWKAAGDGAKSKAQVNKDKAAAQKAEADAKRAEAKKLAAEEEREMAKLAKKKTAKPAAPKVTAHQLDKEKAKRAAAAQAEGDTAAQAASRTVTEDSYGALVDGQNVNRFGEGVMARDVDSAIVALSASGKQPDADPHPERRMKAAHLAFEEAEVARLRDEKPGMRTSQYKDLAWKRWQKSPLNPKVQAALRAQEGIAE